MSKKNNQNVADENGVQVGGEATGRKTYPKSFDLSSTKTNKAGETWPTKTDEEGNEKPVKLRFDAIIDLNDVTYQTVLDDAVRTKVITLQGVFRTAWEAGDISFAALQEMAKQPVHRHYEAVGKSIESPEKAMRTVQESIASLSPEQLAALKKQLAGM